MSIVPKNITNGCSGNINCGFQKIVQLPNEKHSMLTWTKSRFRILVRQEIITNTAKRKDNVGKEGQNNII